MKSTTGLRDYWRGYHEAEGYLLEYVILPVLEQCDPGPEESAPAYVRGYLDYFRKQAEKAKRH